MNPQRTPLGFISGDIETRSHCMYTYSRKDETFVRNIVDFLSAGMNAGELCVCFIEQPHCDEISSRIAQVGPPNRLGDEAAQLIIRPVSEIYLRDGLFDTQALIRFWQARLESARRWNGIRVFADTAPLFDGRASRLKLLEYEAMINTHFRMNLALCGYDTTAVGRSFLFQARNTHPFIANSRSIRRNATYLVPSRFLSGFYRFRRVSKEYPALVGAGLAVASDLEEMASRTPLTMREMDALKQAICRTFTHMVQSRGPERECPPDQAHIHITFTAESDKMLVTIRGHACGFVPPYSDQHEQMRDNSCLVEGMVDELSVELWKSDTVVTIMKRYRTPSFAMTQSGLAGDSIEWLQAGE